MQSSLHAKFSRAKPTVRVSSRRWVSCLFDASKNLTGDISVHNGGDNAETSVALRTFQNVGSESASEKRTPIEGSRCSHECAVAKSLPVGKRHHVPLGRLGLFHKHQVCIFFFSRSGSWWRYEDSETSAKLDGGHDAMGTSS